MNFEENKLYRGSVIGKASKYPDYLLIMFYMRLQLDNGKKLTVDQALTKAKEIFINICKEKKTDLEMFYHPSIIDASWISTSNTPVTGQKLYIVARIKTDKGRLFQAIKDELDYNKPIQDPYSFINGYILLNARYRVDDEMEIFAEGEYKCILNEPILKIKPETKGVFGGMLDEL